MRKCRLLTIVSALLLMLTLGIFVDSFGMVSNAQSQGKVVVRSANIRQEADANSTVLGSAAQGASVTINGQTTGTDGNVWYQVFVNADTLGYIRSDLVEVITENATTTEPTNENMAEVTAVQPTSATVTGAASVNVRANASTGSSLVGKAQRDLAITVTGTAMGNDGKTWYQINFIADGSQVNGFIRSDYVSLSGDLLPVTTETETPTDPQEPTEPEVPAEPEVKKDWDTELRENKWKLIDNVNSKSWDIDNIFDTVTYNQNIAKEMEGKVKSQTIVIIILVIVAVLMGGFIAVLFFKIKDMTDSAYVEAVERETIRRRTADRPVSGEKKVMHTVGAEKKPNGARPAGTRPAGTPGQGGNRPGGARPAGAPGQGGNKPSGARPAGAPGQSGNRPGGARPVGASGQGGERPVGTRPAGASGQGASKPVAPETRPAQAPKQTGKQNQGWQSKNFMTDDDEFEFEFLNWDGDDE